MKKISAYLADSNRCTSSLETMPIEIIFVSKYVNALP
jgi:hypothetical protein